MNRWGVLSLLGVLACDQDHGASDAEGEAEHNETVSEMGAIGGGVFGADPESGAFVAGRADYTPSDPGLRDGAVVLGEMARRSGRVIAPLKDWQGGPVIASEGVDEVAAALAVEPRTERAARVAARGSWLVVGGRVVVAEGPSVEVSWAGREASEVALGPVAGEAFVARLPLALARVPEEVRAVIGAEVRVFDQAREVCIARIAGLMLEARLVHEAFGPWEPRYSEREVLARGLRQVVATLEPLAGDAWSCEGGVVAVGVEAHSPRLFAEVETLPSARRKAVAVMCGVSTWQAMRGVAEAPRPHSRECRRLAETAEVRSFETRSGERFVVVASDGVQAGLSGEGLELAWAYVSEARALGVVDVMADGTPELMLAPSGRLPSAVGGVRLAGDLSAPTFEEDWTPVPPLRTGVGGYAVPDYSVFRER